MAGTMFSESYGNTDEPNATPPEGGKAGELLRTAVRPLLALMFGAAVIALAFVDKVSGGEVVLLAGTTAAFYFGQRPNRA